VGLPRETMIASGQTIIAPAEQYARLVAELAH
jgi:hypothetical protein